MREKLNYLLKYQYGGMMRKYGNKLSEMFMALKNRGLNNQPAFEIAWQSLKEQPNRWYSFGNSFNNVDSWADNVVNHQLKRNIYKRAKDSTNFWQYRQATLPYNRNAGYTEWLLQGRNKAKDYINNYMQQNNIDGKPIAYNLLEQNNNLNSYV